MAYYGPGGRIYFEHQDNLKSADGLYSPYPDEQALGALVSIRSVAPSGGDERIHAVFPARRPPFAASNMPLVSPDGKWVAYQAARDIYVAPLRAGKKAATFDPDPNRQERGVRRISRVGGIFHRWRNDGRVEFADGRNLVVVDPRTGQETRTPVDLVLPGPAP